MKKSIPALHISKKGLVGLFRRLVELGAIDSVKETTLERADFTLQLLMLVTAEKERVCCVYNFLSFLFLGAVVSLILS